MNEVEFCRWENDCFGFGYGNGELHVMKSLKSFLSLCIGENCQYDFKNLEKFLGGEVTWLLINALCRSPHDRRLRKDSAVEYGTSPRFGWLTKEGKELKEFCENKTAEQLCDILDHYDDMEDDVYCV